MYIYICYHIHIDIIYMHVTYMIGHDHCLFFSFAFPSSCLFKNVPSFLPSASPSFANPGPVPPAHSRPPDPDHARLQELGKWSDGRTDDGRDETLSGPRPLFSFPSTPPRGRRSACDAVVIVGVDPLYKVFKHAYEGGAMNGVRYGCLRWRVFNCAPIRCETRCWQSVLFSSLLVASLLVMTLLGAFEAHGGAPNRKIASDSQTDGQTHDQGQESRTRNSIMICIIPLRFFYFPLLHFFFFPP